MPLSHFSVGFKMDDVNFQRLERPRKRGRPLTYEEKWIVQHVFETFEKEKNAGAIVQIQDPYSLTSKYTGVARSIVATIAKSVRQTGNVPLATPLGNRQQPTAIPLSIEGRVVSLLFGIGFSRILRDQESQEKGTRWNPINNSVPIVIALILANPRLALLKSTVTKNAAITAPLAARPSVSRERAPSIICGPRAAMSWKPLACGLNARVF